MFSKHKQKKTATENPATPADTQAEPTIDAAEAPAGATPPAPETEPVEEPAQPSPEALELAAAKDRLGRLMADFDNYRKRQVREREELIKRANEELIGDLLPIVDHIELALGKTPDLANPFVAGVKLVYDQFLTLLERYGATPIDAKGQPFNPDWHEALSQMSSATVPANDVIDQFRRGWCLAGRLLRPTQVIVSSGAPDDDQAAAESASVSD
jgi:molecular chaperone GrpE